MNHKRWLPYTLNHLNFGFARKNFRVSIKLNKSTLALLKILKKTGLVSNYNIVLNKTAPALIVYLYYYKNCGLTKHCRLISSASKSFFITKRMLLLLDKRLGDSFLFLSNNEGIMTHKTALEKNIGGKILLLIL